MSSSDPAHKDITVYWESTHSASHDIEIVVILPTFKRPDHLLTTLASVVDQMIETPYAVVVMDNHADVADGAKAATDYLKHTVLPATVILAHRRGNCAAYNAGIEIALDHYPSAKWIQIIDDDEIAQPSWLSVMKAVGERYAVDFVGAPQVPVFPVGTDVKWAEHPVFRAPYDETGPVPILYSSGNVLISVNRLNILQRPWFDERFNFLGGGDSDLYSRCQSVGARFAWCAEAPVMETTPNRRTELSWLNSRSLRNGSISALIQQKAARGTTDSLSRIIKTCLLLAAAPYRSLILFVKTRSLTMALNPINVAMGRILMEFGFANEQYRAADKN